MPPPAEATPLLIVIPSMVTVWPGLTWKIRKGAAATSRCTERTSAPGPLIVTFFVIISSPLVRMIAELGTLKVMVSPSCAAASAWRNEPAPLSPVLVTVMPGGVWLILALSASRAHFSVAYEPLAPVELATETFCARPADAARASVSRQRNVLFMRLV